MKQYRVCLQQQKLIPKLWKWFLRHQELRFYFRTQIHNKFDHHTEQDFFDSGNLEFHLMIGDARERVCRLCGGGGG